MPTLLRAVAALALAMPWAALSAPAFTVTPANPTSMDMVRVTKMFDNEDVHATQIAMAGNKITVTLVCAGGFPEAPPYTVKQAIGRFPRGDYEVEVVSLCASTRTSLGVQSFSVVDPDAFPRPLDDYSDIWWNPGESGWGLNIAQHASGQVFATWFVYGADGSPAWYVIPGGRWMSSTQFDGDVYRTTGPVVAATFDPAAVTRVKVGSAQLVFGPNGVLDAQFFIDNVTVAKRLQRQSF